MFDEVFFYDETAYLARGVKQSLSQSAPFTDGASYSDMYWLLGRFVGDKVSLYFLGRATAAVVFVVCVWLCARIVGQPRIAWVAAVVAAATPAPYVWPSVAAPAAGLLAVSVTIMFRWPGPESCSVAAGLSWLAAASRPEFVWWAVVLSLAAIAWFLLSLRRVGWLPASGALVVGGVILLPALLIAYHGSPLDTSNRQWAAFGQHYALRHATDGEDPWTQWQEIVRSSFSNAGSVREAVIENPWAVIAHFGANALDAPGALLGVLGTTDTPAGLVRELIVLTFGASLLVGLIIAPRASYTNAREMLSALTTRRYRMPLILACLFCLSAVIPIVVVFPREHYLLVWVAVLITAGAFLLHRVVSSRLQWLFPVACTAVLFGFFGHQMLEARSQREAFPAVRAEALRVMQAAPEARLWGRGDWGRYGPEVYVPGLVAIESQPLPGESIDEFLERNEVSVVLINEQMRAGAFGSPEGLGPFLENPRNWGFREAFAGSGFWLRNAPVSDDAMSGQER